MNRRAPDDRTMKSIDRARGKAEAKVSDAQASIAVLTLMIEKLSRAIYGRLSERSERLVGQLEPELDELTASGTDDELRAETTPDRTTEVKGFERRRPSRKPFPEHLPRERVVVPAPESRACCGSQRLSKVPSRSRTRPPSNKTRAPSKADIIVLRCTSRKSNGERVSSKMAGVAYSLLG